MPQGHNGPGRSLLDGLGAGVGYGVVIVLIGLAREIFGSGAVWGVQIIPQGFYDLGYVNNGIMVLGPGAFLCLGIIIWLHRTWNDKLVEQE